MCSVVSSVSNLMRQLFLFLKPKGKWQKNPSFRPNRRDHLTVVQHPLASLDPKDLTRLAHTLARSASQRFSPELNHLEGMLRAAHPLKVLSMLSAYGTTGKAAADFGQPLVELTQALVLRVPPEELSTAEPKPELIQELFDRIPKVAEGFSLKRLGAVDESLPPDEKSLLGLQEWLRMHTLGIRNWGYYRPVVTILMDLCDPIDDAFERGIGVRATTLVRLFEQMVDRSDHRLKNHLLLFREVFAAGETERMIRKYHELRPLPAGALEELVAFVKSKAPPVDHIKCLLVLCSGFGNAEDRCFSCSDFSKESEVAPAVLASALSRLSLSLGDLSSDNPEHLFLHNPVRTCPLIKLDEQRFFCAIPLVFFSFSFRILHEVAKATPPLEKAYLEGKSAYLEAAMARTFREAFPGSDSVQNYRWKDGGVEYETDLLVRVGSHLLIVEAKSGGLSAATLRGAPKSMKDDVLELIIGPSVQSSRFQERIHRAMANPSLRESLLPGLTIDVRQIHTVIRLSVTLEDLATVQSQLYLLGDTGWLPPKHQLAPCIQLSDLAIVFELLRSRYQRLHYLTSRCQLEVESPYLGSELDLLGLYLKTGFNLQLNQDGKLDLMGMSSEIDDYYAAEYEGVHRPRPHLALSSWWSDICDTLERRAVPRWSEATDVLLSMTLMEQETLERLFQDVAKGVRKQWRRKHHKCTAIFIPPEGRTNAVCLYAFRDAAMSQRNARIENIAGQIFARPHVSRCAIVGVNIDQEQRPYSTLQLFTRTHGDRGAQFE